MHRPFVARDNADPAADPFAGAGPEELHAIDADFNVDAAVDHEFAIAAYQRTVLRHHRHLERDAIGVQLALQNLANLHAVQNQRLPGVDAVAFRRGERDGRDIRLFQNGFIGMQHGKLVAGFTLAGDQLEGGAGQQGADAGVFQRDFWLLHLNQRLLAQQADDARVDGHFAGHFPVAIEIQLTELANLQALVHQRRRARF